MTDNFMRCLIIPLFFLSVNFVCGQRIMEKLDRGAFAAVAGTDSIFIGWRLLGSDPQEIAFNVYRNQTKITESPLKNTTSLMDTAGSEEAVYTLVPVIDGTNHNALKEIIKVQPEPWIDIPLQTPENYSPGDASTGDLDGDGSYEIVLHQIGRGHDNAHTGFTTAPIFQAYKMDGTLLWEINLGKNIREGAHYTQFMVYDFDGDGKAEFACKTADGTTDGLGNVIGDPEANYVNSDGRILDGPEFLTIFDGMTGEALFTTDYIPSRYPIDGWGGIGGNGGNDNYGNRVERFLACVAYLDGVHPSLVMCRGYYGRSVLAAWDWDGQTLKKRWVFDSSEPGLEKYSGMGNHNLSIADVDNDGKDEIIYGAMTVDDDGTGLYSTDLRHGDAMHVSNLVPERPGLEVWGIHENEEPVEGYENVYGAALFDTATGEIIWGKLPGIDVGSGVAADIDSTHAGAEMWCSGGKLWNTKGETVGELPVFDNFLVWWDGDLLREIISWNRIIKYSGETIFTAPGFRSASGSKATPVLSADLFGDWREEVILAADDNQSLRVFTTTVPTQHRIITLMHDPQYRLSVAWQNVAYNQPPHTSFFLGHGMEFPVLPDKNIQFK